ncbi:unnamed protein product [Callosobruchus maculatus]|uniref:Uncharacterized protein n=1 Tax=Callosobruchus maculatus TaxID=64391 RepID=A0A653CJ22_CALMS|nr:unnamed protein product [Callosobruchus maculatus]
MGMPNFFIRLNVEFYILSNDKNLSAWLQWDVTLPNTAMFYPMGSV